MDEKGCLNEERIFWRSPSELTNKQVKIFLSTFIGGNIFVSSSFLLIELLVLFL